MPAATKPRWLSAIIDALSKPENKGKVVYQVATVDSSHVPHVRTQVHRGFIIPKSAPHLPLLVTSSDVRAPKVAQMRSSENKTNVELCWWMEGSQDQFRIAGKTTVVHDKGPESDSLSGLIAAALDEGGDAEDESAATRGKYDWEAKRRAVFDAMKPEMKASWSTPIAPGSPIPSYPTEDPPPIPTWEDIKTEEERRAYEVALGNFAMVLVEPVRVDWVQLGVRPNRRTVFTRRGGEDGSGRGQAVWEEEIVVA